MSSMVTSSSTLYVRLQGKARPLSLSTLFHMALREPYSKRASNELRDGDFIQQSRKT